MSTVQAFELGLAAEKKAHDFYDMALPGITDPEVRALFTELNGCDINGIPTMTPFGLIFLMLSVGVLGSIRAGRTRRNTRSRIKSSRSLLGAG